MVDKKADIPLFGIFGQGKTRPAETPETIILNIDSLDFRVMVSTTANPNESQA